MSLTAPTHQTSPHEIRDLLAVVERDLHDSGRSHSVVAMTASPDEQGSHGMSRSTIRPKRATRRTAARADAARLDRLIEEATVDCYNESEQAVGLFTMLEEHLALPFTTKVLGVEVTVERVDITSAETIVAICRRGHTRQQVPILDLPLPSPTPKGAEWIDAYRRWIGAG
jgi:hypothetical protein